MNGVKLAPLTGLTAKTKNTHVQLESLSSVIAAHSISTLNIRNDNVMTSVDRHNTALEKPITNISGAIAATIDSAQTNENICNITKSSPLKKEKRSKTDSYSPLSVSDVNSLWGVYLKQQKDLGVDISDKQAMAKAYHVLGKKEIKVLKELSGKSDSDEDVAIASPQKKKVKIVQKETKKLVEPPRTGKPVNKRQKRKKMIRDELKRQLSMFTILPETEGFPWKAIVSEKGYRNLKLEGWPDTIPLTKRIDDFSPTELDKFEENLKNGTIKIVKMEGTKHETTKDDSD